MSGYVILATHRDKPKVRIAVKVMPLTAKLDKAVTESMFNRELGTFNKTDHRGLAKCIMAIRGPDYLAIAMKFYPLGDLGSCVMTLPSTVQTWFAGRLSEAVAYLHHKRIVHGDIKLQNVFVDEGFTPVLGDFGLCRCIREDVLTITADRFGGTEHYWAPEIRDRDNQMLVDPFKVDTYALGVVILAFVALVKPTIDTDYFVMVNISNRIPSCHRRMLDPDFTPTCAVSDVMRFCCKLEMMFASRSSW
ncbi:testis-specific serine/threonine-protein kinase 1 [Plakobranchus ocellatus]|uniref:Testis-specific serine/threonine-protein kinase 1 n=1 Tax=Plakobranchus ocellatus TaxID=259542 RepID=A0AAV4DZ21_9GAST|nr:testis-specific serine/threonine-protein kinase 1 [Plakobranchus ocellatus]